METPHVRNLHGSQEILKNYIKDSFAEMGLRLKRLEDMFPGTDWCWACDRGVFTKRLGVVITIVK